MLLCCCNRVPLDWVTIRGYDIDDGEILWEHKLWSAVMSSDGSVVGFQLVESSEDYSHVYHAPASTGAIPARGDDTHTTTGRTTWEYVITRIDVTDGTITEQTNVLGYLVADDGDEPNLPSSPFGSFAGGGSLRFPVTTQFRTQNYSATEDYYLSNNPSLPVITYFDPHSTSPTLKYRIEAHGMNPTWGGASYNSATWELGIPAYDGDPATSASWAHNASAATIKAALEAEPQITSATVTGGPLPGTAVVMEIEWADNSLQFDSITLTEFDMGSTLVCDSGTGQVVGWGQMTDGVGVAYRFATDGKLIRSHPVGFGTTTGAGFTAITAATEGWQFGTSPPAAGIIWTATVDDPADVISVRSKIVVGCQLEPPDTDATATAGINGRLVTLSLTDGSELSDTDIVYRFPDVATLADDDATIAYVNGKDWAPVDTADTTPSTSEAGNYGFRHDDLIDDLTDGLNPQYGYLSGVPGIGATSTKLAFGVGYAAPPTDPAEVVYVDVNHITTTTAHIGGDDRYPASYTLYTHKPCHQQDRPGTDTEWRIGLRGPGEDPLEISTDWMAYDADFDDVNEELRVAFGEHTAASVDTNKQNVRMSFDPTNNTAVGASIANMLWQGDEVRIEVIGGVAGTPNNLLSTTYSNFGSLVIGLRNQTFARNKSFGAMTWSTGAIAWQSDFGRTYSTWDVQYGEGVALESGVLVVKGAPSRRQVAEAATS